MEFTFFHGHQTGVFPVGDVDLVVFQHGVDGVTQQRGVVTGQGSHDQHGRLALEFAQGRRVVRKALEAAQLAERLVDFNALVDGHINAIDIDRADAEFRFFVVFAQAVDQVVTGRNALSHGQVAEGHQRVVEQLGGRLCQVGKRFDQGTLRVVDLVKHVAVLKKCCSAI